MKLKRIPLTVMIAVLALALAACTVTIRPSAGIEVNLNTVINDFRPTRGVGAIYRIGDQIEFLVNTNQAGYVTLTAIDPDGRVYVLSRNVYVAGGTTILPTADQRVSYSAGPPRGFHRVRASFTSSPTSGSVVYRGRSGDGAWSAAINVEIRDSPVRDVVETNLTIR